VLYHESPPAEVLRSHVLCRWWRMAPGGGPVNVVPDACLDIVWRSDGQLGVAGPDTGPVAVVGPDGVGYAGVRFRPGAAPPLLGLPASELRDRRVDLADLWGAAAARRLSERIADRPDAAAELLEEALLERLAPAAPIDPLAPALLRRLGEGAPSLPALAGELGLSERQLRRRCEAAFGYGPKTLDRVLRFRRFLALSRGGGGLADLALAAGYADQAHLGHECRRLAGATPAELHRP
jgi:AraC-like DNA-binding protein